MNATHELPQFNDLQQLCELVVYPDRQDHLQPRQLHYFLQAAYYLGLYTDEYLLSEEGDLFVKRYPSGAKATLRRLFLRSRVGRILNKDIHGSGTLTAATVRQRLSQSSLAITTTSRRSSAVWSWLNYLYPQKCTPQLELLRRSL